MKISKEKEMEWRRPLKRTKQETKELSALIRKDTARVRKQVKILEDIK